MGYYVNPRSGTKEQYLAQFGQPITEAEAGAHTAGDDVVVCLVNNGAFTAAGIAYDDRERDAWTKHPDQRVKRWYLVNRAKLVTDGFLDD